MKVKDISKVFDKEIIGALYLECGLKLRSNNQLTPVDLLNYLLDDKIYPVCY